MESTLIRELESLHEASFAWALACCSWNRAEAEDVLQTVYLKVLDGRARFGGRSSLKTWLFTVIRNTAADGRRWAWLSHLALDRLRAHPSEDECAPSGDDAVERARVRTAIAALAPRQREIIDLVFYHDFTIEEAARVMRVSLGSARVHYDRGKKRLAEVL